MMKRVKMTLGQAVIKFFDNQYLRVDGEEIKFVEGAWAIFGHGCVLGMGEALEAQDALKHSLKLYQGHNEQGMAHAAIAFAKQNRRRRIMAAISSIGPGATNMVTAAATATVNRIPLLLLPGDVFACRQPDPVLQQLEQSHDLSLSVNDAFKPVCKFWDRISRPEQFISSGINAMRVLTDPAETGAVCLSLPQDVQAETHEFPAEFLEKRVHEFRRPQPSNEDIRRLSHSLRKYSRPLIIAGGGIAYSGAEKELIEFAEKCNIPIAETQGGKGYLSPDHLLNLGTVGVTGTLAANRAAKQADLIIAMGTRLNDFITSSKSAFDSDCRFITVNLNPFEAYKVMATPVIADAKTTLQALSQEFTGESKGGFPRSNFGEDIQKDQQTWRDEVKRVYNTQLPDEYSQMRALGQLNLELLPKNAIIVAASGSLPGDLGRFWQTYAPGGYHLEYGYSCMGYEVAGALGAKLAEPEREVYCLVGDGSYLLLHSEIFTAIQEGIKINIILFDNNGFHCIDNLQTKNGIPSFGCEFRYRDSHTGRLTGDYIPVDYATQARGYGCETWSVADEAGLVKAMNEAQKSKVSTLIDIKVGRKTMSDDYESWWRVGVPQVSSNPVTEEKSRDLEKKKPTLRDF